MKLILLALFLIAVIGAPAALFFLSTETQLEMTPPIHALGKENSILLKTTNPHGVRQVALEVSQGTARARAGEEFPKNRLMFWRHHLAPVTYTLKMSLNQQAGFRSGPARMRITAVSNDLRGQTTVRESDVVVNLEPPGVKPDGEIHVIAQGGTGLITFTAEGYWTEAGVRIGDSKFRSYPLPGTTDRSRRFALFSIPWNAPAGAEPVVYARNDTGQEVQAAIRYKLQRKKFRRRTIDLKDDFMRKVAQDILNDSGGDLLKKFLHINGDVRKENNRALADLRLQTEEKLLWQPPFLQLSNSKVEAHFADVRTYLHEGKQVDEQAHLGFDLSTVKESPVAAANDGRVVFAGRLGIYGNCIVIDHGYALQSIYGHLSSIGVKVGDRVKKLQEIGRSGQTGLAGGDHLHFAMQLDGTQVNPLEWWDEKFIQKRILDMLAK